jgi:hypothetical protein
MTHIKGHCVFVVLVPRLGRREQAMNQGGVIMPHAFRSTHVDYPPVC